MATTTIPLFGLSVKGVGGWEGSDDPLSPLGSLFPLGPPSGIDTDDGSEPSQGSRPFGLTLLAEACLDDAVDLTGVRYCETRQMLTMGERPAVLVSSSFTTPTRTKADSRQWTDYEQDSD